MIPGKNLNGVIAVLVVYERNLEEVKPWKRLLELLNSNMSNGLNLCHILIYDNSAKSRAKPPLLSDCSYVHNSKNEGTAAAYSCAVQLAKNLKLGWLLLLDHDTQIPQGFFTLASDALIAETIRPAALLPWVVHAERAVSPARITWSGSFKPIARNSGLLPHQHLTGIASASFIDASSFEEICPIPKPLWLDYVDHWIFLRFNAMGKKIVVFEAVVQHELSIYEPSTVSRTRIFNILDAEKFFIASFPWYVRFIYPLRIGLRIIRQILSHPGGALNMLAWVVKPRKKT